MTQVQKYSFLHALYNQDFSKNLIPKTLKYNDVLVWEPLSKKKLWWLYKT